MRVCKGLVRGLIDERLGCRLAWKLALGTPALMDIRDLIKRRSGFSFCFANLHLDHLGLLVCDLGRGPCKASDLFLAASLQIRNENLTRMRKILLRFQKGESRQVSRPENDNGENFGSGLWVSLGS